jgi:hypothetical protein
MYGFEHILQELLGSFGGIIFFYYIIRFIAYFHKLEIMSHWGLLLDMQFSTKEFFERLKQRLVDSEVKNISYTTLNLNESIIGLSKRTYLTIKYKDYVFFVCGAPFGKYFFTSYWSHFKPSIGEMIIRALPFFGNSLANVIFSLTYFEYDQAASFQTLLHHHITELIKEMTTEKGIPMPELPKPVMNDVFKR